MVILSELSEAGLLGGDEGGSSWHFGRGGDKNISWEKGMISA